MSLNIQVNLKQLYKQLCKPCRKKLIACCKVAPNEAAIIKALSSEDSDGG